MDKAEERRVFDLVYGHRDWTVESCEAPDFRCLRDGLVILGAEVTELHRSESDARLKRIPNYLDQVLDGTYRHKDDAAQLQVAKIQYKDSNGNSLEYPAVVRNALTFDEVKDLLLGIITVKERRVEKYRDGCPAVDLIIHDVDDLIRPEEFPGLLSRLVAAGESERLIQSQFREIFVLTTALDEASPKLLPLKLNSVGFEISAYQRVMRAELQHLPAGEQLNTLPPFLFCLQKATHGTLTFREHEETFSLHVGAWEFEQGPDGLRFISRPSMITTSIGNAIEEENRLRPEELAFAQRALAARQKINIRFSIVLNTPTCDSSA